MHQLTDPLLSLLASGLLCLHLGDNLVGLGSEEVIPPSEGGSVVANELLVVNIVVVSSGPKWEEVVKRPWELVSGVSIDGLEEAEDDPDVHGYDVKVPSGSNPKDWDTDGSETKGHDLNWGGKLSGNTEWGGVLVMELVDTTVERSPVESAVEPVMPGILEDEEDGDLVSDSLPGWERSRGSDSEVLSQWVEHPDLWQFDSEVLEEDKSSASELLLKSVWMTLLNLVLLEVGDVVNNHPWDASTKIDDLVHHERHDTCSEDIILHVLVPRSPQFLSSVEINLNSADLVVNGPVSAEVRRKDGCDIRHLSVSPKATRSIERKETLAAQRRTKQTTDKGR